VPKFTWDIDPAILHIGSYELRYYSLIFVAVFLGGYQLLKWQIVRGGGREEDASDFFVYGVLAVLIGARLGHVIFYDYQKALEDPLWILQIWTGGLASHGAVVGLVVAMWMFTRKKGVSFLEGADRFSFAAALGATLVRLGNFFNSEIVGRKTDQTWGVRFPRYDRGPDIPYRHPSQLYEVGLGLFVMLVLWLVDRAAGREKRPRGLLVSVFFAVYFTGRFFVEYVKEYQVPDLGERGLTMGQMLSLPCIALGLFGIYYSLKHKIPAGWVREDEDDDLEDDEDLDDEDDNLEDEDEDEDLEQDQDDTEGDDEERDSDASASAHDADVDEEFGPGASKRRPSEDKD